MAEKWLVIDDSATIQRVIKLAFQDYDVNITEAESCQEALRELGRSTPSLVIADAALAGVQSIRDFSLLQQSATASAFVILEGSYDHIDEAQFRAAGFKNFLKKPFDASQLIQVTRHALGRAIPHRFQDKPELPQAGGTRESPSSPPPPPSISGFHSSRMSEESKATQSRPDVDLGFGDTRSFHEDEGEGSIKMALEKQIRSEVTKALGQMPQFAREDTRSGHGGGESKVGPISFDLTEEFSEKTPGSSYSSASLSGMLEPMLQGEMGKLVRQAVEEYCRKHFAGIARELLLRELEKLTQDRSRLLVDK